MRYKWLGTLNIAPKWRKRYVAGVLASLVLIIWFWRALPDPLFDDPVAIVLEDRAGQLLSARIAQDEQWRFPMRDSVAANFTTALIEFEDGRFYSHPGVDMLAMARAMRQNIAERRVVSGASTLSMQVIRLSRKGKSRTIWEKLIESILALRLELRFTKAEILALYAAHAPFGGNIVGLDAAAWRYYGRAPEQLSWSEVATLAVLPNNPALVHPGRNRDLLRAKRDRLLQRLHENGQIDGVTMDLAMAETLPAAPSPLPDVAPHLLNRVQAELSNHAGAQRVRTTLDDAFQRRAQEIVNRHQDHLEANGTHNAAALIIENRTGNVLAYIGNVDASDDAGHGRAVDVVMAPRSTGSILKPFLYAAMLDDAQLLPRTLVADIPTRFGGFAPVNFDQGFEGSLPADEALARSLNVPAVRLLRQYGVDRFHALLQQMGMKTLTQPPSHYGLSLILGGSEGTLWDLAGMYAGMARVLLENEAAQTPIRFKSDSQESMTNAGDHRLSAASIWLTFEALSNVKRPEAEGLWEYFSSSRKIAWKTGTSFGFRDAWAIGVTPNYTVAVWVGNADGEGRPGLTGVTAAAPILFELFDILNVEDVWFAQPVHDMELIEVCTRSGHRAGRYCTKKDAQWITKPGLRTSVCPYHRHVSLNATQQWRVHGDCASPMEMVHASWFVLPPAMEWFYKIKQGSYRPLPPFRSDCRSNNQVEEAMAFIYPTDEMTIYVPTELDGTAGSAILEIAHRKPETRIHWHLDGNFLSTTRHFHQLQIHPQPGPHKLVAIDESGARIEQSFVVAASR